MPFDAVKMNTRGERTATRVSAATQEMPRPGQRRDAYWVQMDAGIQAAKAAGAESVNNNARVPARIQN